MTVQLPSKRRQKVLNELRTARKRTYKKKVILVKTLAKSIGMLSTTRIQFSKACFYLKYLFNYLHSRVNEEGWDTWTLLADEAK
jgi:hypothetical protein